MTYETLTYQVDDTGVLNQTTQIWACDDLNDREIRRAALAADIERQTVATRLSDAVESQESRLPRPTSFSPLR